MQDAAAVVSLYQDLTNAQVGNTLSQSSIDLGVAGTPPDAFQAIGSIIADYGRGAPMYVECRVTTAFTSGSSTATVRAQLVQADDAALSVNLNVLEESDAIIVTTLVQNYRFRLGSVGPGVTRRFIGMRYVVAVEALTAGTIWAAITRSKIDKPVTN